MSNKERPSPDPDHDWSAFDGPVLPEDPETLDQYMGAKNCSWQLYDIVGRCLEHDLPIDTVHIRDYVRAWRAEWLADPACPDEPYTLTHVLACAKREMLHCEQHQYIDDRYHAVVATHDLLEEALTLQGPDE